MHSTQQVVYLAHANVHTNHLLVYSAQYTLCNQLSVVKLSISAITHNMIGYYHEIYLNISHSSLVVEKCYA